MLQMFSFIFTPKKYLLYDCPSYSPHLQMPNEQPTHRKYQQILGQIHIIEHRIKALGNQIISESFIVIRKRNKWEHRPEGLIGNH
jgi:hypothetical protein